MSFSLLLLCSEISEEGSGNNIGDVIVEVCDNDSTDVDRLVPSFRLDFPFSANANRSSNVNLFLGFAVAASRICST